MLIDENDINLGGKLKRLRLIQGKTLKEAADSIGVTPQFISSVEKGRSGISLPKLVTLFKFYDSSLAEGLSKEDQSDENLVHLDEAEPYLPGDDGVFAAFLFKNKGKQYLEPLYYKMASGSKTEEQQHDEAEFLFILSGAAECTVVDPKTKKRKVYNLVKGDTLHIPQQFIHQTVCNGSQTAEILAVACPRTITKG
jgi:transcriptional regulator with XRE-family HTH domain